MSIFRSMVTNTAARSVTEIANRTGSVLFWIFTARHLGASGLGSLAFALSLSTLFGTFSTLGLGSALIRDVARDRKLAGHYFTQSLWLGSVASLLFSGLMLLVIRFINPGKETIVASSIMACAIVPNTGFYWSRAILWASEKLIPVAIARTIENVFKVVAGLSVLWLGYGIKEVALVILASKIVSFMICFVYAKRLAQPTWHFNKTILVHLLRQAPTFSLIAIFNGLFWSISVILLTKFKGETEAGYFSAAFKLVDMCISFAMAYGQALFPITSRYADKDPKLVSMVCKKSIKFISILTGAIAAGTFILAPHIIPLLYGTEMNGAIPVLRVLIWIVVLFSAVPVLAYTLVSHDLQLKDLLANAFAALTVLVLNIVLVPHFGILGAAFALLIGSFTFLGTEFYFVQKLLFQFHFKWHNLKVVIGVGLMSIIVFLLKDQNIITSSLIGGLTYLIFLWYSKTITYSDIQNIKELKSIS